MRSLPVLATVVQAAGYGFRWRPGIGDPSVAGWVTVLLYFAAVLNCWSVARARNLIPDISGRERGIWSLLALLFLGLGVNKQLDLQTALTEFGRLLANRQGWYEQRHQIQGAFVASVVIVSAVAVLLLWWLSINSPFSTKLSLLGAIGVLGYVAVRAASFHHVDQFIGQSVFGLRWNWVLEMGGITLVLGAATWRLSRRRKRRA